MSLAPTSIWLSAGYRTAYRLTFLPLFLRSALTKVLPIWPGPTGSNRPRAKMTSTAGQAADAVGIPIAVTAGVTSRAAAVRAVTNVATTSLRISCGVTQAMLADVDDVPVASRGDRVTADRRRSSLRHWQAHPRMRGGRRRP